MKRSKRKTKNRRWLVEGTLAGLVIIIATAVTIYFFTRVQAPRLPDPPLKTLAAGHKIELGNFAISSYLNAKPYTDILTSQFNLTLADNTPNWYFTDGGLRPSPASYNFKQMDQVVNFAESHHMAIQAHHFVWGEEKWLPAWLKNGNYSPPQLLELIRQHILTVGGRYKGHINEWTVVNEAFSRAQHVYGLHDWWADQIGGQSYIDKSFIWARQTDPNAKLILNDFGNETENSISNAMYNYIKEAKARGVPIDGIGMQMHIDGTNPPSKEAVIANMRRFAQLGVGVYVTEFDVNMNDVKLSSSDKDKKEARIYYDMMRACIESRVCHSFAILGITDKETWYNHIGLKDPRPLPFDKKYQPKPAYYSLRLALQQP
jgi:endo-1,4-beta-xylanase